MVLKAICLETPQITIREAAVDARVKESGVRSPPSSSYVSLALAAALWRQWGRRKWLRYWALGMTSSAHPSLQGPPSLDAKLSLKYLWRYLMTISTLWAGQTPQQCLLKGVQGGCPPTRELVSLISSILPQPLHRALLAPARLLEACLHSLLSFLTSNFPSNPLLPDPLFSIERLSRRPVASSCAISCYAQVLRAAHLHRRAAGIAHQPCWLKSKGRRTPGRPARGPQDAQREDPRTLSARTPGRPARGPQDAQREDPRTPSARTPRRSAGGPMPSRHATLLDQAKVITQNPAWDPGHTDTDTCLQDPPTVNPSTATGTPCTFPLGHAGAKTLDPGLPLSRETHLLTGELR
ncbi:uncharacterized protein LOC142835222 [Microtus pennsylvanicus]|uniref:uncharacterized protein LOC142835222 n=1 Tax=Microtus pennsylvanicus TaxID=10058 RepID=UPI003F6D7AEC